MAVPDPVPQTVPQTVHTKSGRSVVRLLVKGAWLHKAVTLSRA